MKSKRAFCLVGVVACLPAVATGQEKEEDASALARAEVANVYPERGVLTQKGRLVIEPSFSYAYSTQNQVAIEGYTIIPSLVVGLINVSQVQRDTLTGAVGLRYGVTDKLEVDLRIPYVYKEETVREREIFDGSAVDLVRDSDGSGLGDIELGLRYQFNRRGDGPYWVGGVRIKSDTGDGPFDVEREQLVVEDAQGDPVSIGEVFAQQPTGSGFWAVQPSISFILPSDPAVIYGNLSYTWNIKQDVGAPYGDVDPGDAVGFGLGMGFAFNDRTSYSIGYDHSVVFETERENDPGIEATFSRFQVGTVNFGLTHRIGQANSVSVALGVGATEFAPDVQLSVRMPFNL